MSNQCNMEKAAHQMLQLQEGVVRHVTWGNEHVSTVPPASNAHQRHHSIDLDAMDAVLHEVVMRRLHSPIGYKLLGKDQPPLVVHHSSFSDYVKSMKIVG